MKDLIKNLYGTQNINLELFSQRHFSLVYQFEINGSVKILKISRNIAAKTAEIGKESLHKEAYILKILKDTNIPTPKVEHVGYFRDQEYLIMNKMEGIPIGLIFWQVTHEERIELLRSLIEHLKVIHGLQTVNFEGIDLKINEVPTFKLKLNNYLQDRSNTCYRDDVHDLIDSLPSVFKKDPLHLSLLHNDLGPNANNILVHKKKGKWEIAAIIDWERSRLGNPIEEICRLEFELTKSWMLECLSLKIPNKTKILNMDLVKEYGIINKSDQILQWYRSYTKILPTRWYLQ